jgi:polyisoprenoid-binding protein YceI
VKVSNWIASPLIAFASVTTAAAADNYKIDAAHTHPSLELSHMGISIWRGKFNNTSGSVVLDRAARTGTVDIEVDAASIDFGLDTMNEHARGADWLDVEKFPTMAYTGTIRFDANTPAYVDGEITLRGETRPLQLTINSFNCIDHPFFKKEVCGADAEGELDRFDFGMMKYPAGEAGRKVRLRIQVEALKEG